MTDTPGQFPPAAATPLPTARVPTRQKVTVGMGGMAVFFGQISVKNMAVPVYQMLLGVNPAWLGVVLALPRLWDAFIDPLVGNLSDNWRSRFGRRRPFILIGAIAMAATYGPIWMVPTGWGEKAKLGWLLATSILFYTSYAFFSIPYQSLTFEISPDYDERTQVMGHSAFWAKAGEFIYQWVFTLSQAAIFAAPMLGVRVMNWAVALFVFGFMGSMPAIFGRERYFQRAAHQGRESFWPALREALRQRALLIVMILTLLKLFANMVGSSMDYYLLVYYMSGGNVAHGAYWKGILSTAYAVVGFASIPVLNWSCRRFGKKETTIAVYGLVIFAGIGKWFLFTPGIGWWLLIDPILSGPILVAISMVLPSMMADVCDEDELAHGQRREGMFGAVFMWVQKTGIALAFLGTGLALNWVGFDSKLGGAQSAHTFAWMRGLLAGATSVTAAIGLCVAFYYPITRERAEHTRRLLEARRGAV